MSHFEFRLCLITKCSHLGSNRDENDSAEAFLCSPKYHYQRAPVFAHDGEEKERQSGARRTTRGGLAADKTDFYGTFRTRMWLKLNVLLCVDDGVGVGARRGSERRLAQTRKCASVDKALREKGAKQPLVRW